MNSIFGAFKGVARGVILLVFVAAFPALAWFAASYAERTWDVGFAPVFAGVLILELFLGVCALFGIAPEAEKSVGQAIDRESGEGSFF